MGPTFVPALRQLGWTHSLLITLILEKGALTIPASPWDIPKAHPSFCRGQFLLEIPLRTSSCTAQGSLPNKTLPQLSPSVFPLHEALFLQTATVPSWSVPDTQLFVPLPFPCHQLLFRLSLHLPPACHRLGLGLSLENHHIPCSNHSIGCWRRVGADC